jgi:hypothetical protein
MGFVTGFCLNFKVDCYNTVGGYLSPACGGGKITSPQFFLIDKGILQWCAKGIVIKSDICIVNAEVRYER